MATAMNDRVKDANSDLAERLFREPLDFTYDEDGDTLFIGIGDHSGLTMSEPAKGGVYIDIDVDNHKIAGLRILSFSSRVSGRKVVQCPPR
jgi:uncharacterized protein YuzE